MSGLELTAYRAVTSTGFSSLKEVDSKTTFLTPAIRAPARELLLLLRLQGLDYGDVFPVISVLMESSPHAGQIHNPVFLD
jgi:hypothetical protein